MLTMNACLLVLYKYGGLHRCQRYRFGAGKTALSSRVLLSGLFDEMSRFYIKLMIKLLLFLYGKIDICVAHEAVRGTSCFYCLKFFSRFLSRMRSPRTRTQITKWRLVKTSESAKIDESLVFFPEQMVTSVGLGG